MKTIKIFFAAALVLVGMSVSAQWSTSGTNIYNTNTGNVGIGTSSPTETLDITRSSGSAGVILNRPYGDIANQTLGYFRVQNPTTSDVLNIAFRKFNGDHEMVQSAYSSSAGRWLAYSYLNLTTQKYEIRNGIIDVEFLNTGNILLSNTGNVGIGTSSIPSGYKLAVDGKIICEELMVELSTSWPDYVFKPNYKLSPLSEVESFINENGHLPGIPSAEEVEANGVSVGEMNVKLMEKIEELTLYVIELQKDIDILKKQ